MSQAVSISDQQLEFFRLFGYLKFEGVLTDKIDSLTQAFDKAFSDNDSEVVHWDHVVHHNLPRKILPQITDKSPEIRQLIQDDAVVSIATRVLGENYKYIGSDANIFDCGTRWHTDIIGLPYNCQNLKLLFYLDPSKTDEDCFRVIPGSQFHTDRFAKQLKKNIREPDENLGMSVEDVPAIQIATNPGDVVMFDARVWHAVDYAGNTRRAFSFLFGDENYEPPKEGNTHPVQEYE